MKVIVCFDETRITVPCGTGELLVKDLVGDAILRYKRATGKGPKVKIRVHTVKSASDGGILDFNDQIVAVADDREQLIALYEEEEEDELDVPLHGSDGMSAGSGSTDTWRPDSENSELTSLSLNGAGPRNPPVLNPNQRWHLERSGLIADDDENGIEIKEDDVNFKSDLALSVRHGSDSALDNQKDGVADTVNLMQQHQPHLKRWSTAAAVHYSEAPEIVRNKIIVPLPAKTNPPVSLPAPPRRDQPAPSPKPDLSPAGTTTFDKWSTTYHNHKTSAPTGAAPIPVTEPAEEESVVAVVPRPGQPVGLHLVPAEGTRGLRIQAIDANSVAELSGLLHINDRIVDVNGQKVDGLDFGRAQDVLRSAVAQGGTVKIRVSSAVAHTTATTALSSTTSSSSSASPSSNGSSSTEHDQPPQPGRDLEVPRRKRTPPPLPPKPKLPADLETMLLRANYEAGLDYTPDVVVGGDGQTDHLYTTYGSIRRPGRKLTIDLLKGSDGLGFTVTTRDNPAGTICPIYVKSILSKGAAFKDGRLKSGDRLIEVNGTDLSGKSQDEVVNLLRGIPLNTEVVLVVARPETTTSPVLPRLLDTTPQSLVSDSSQEAWDKNKEIVTFDIPLNDSGSAGLGVRVTGKTSGKEADGTYSDCGIFVMNVIHGGAASKDGRLMPMDQLLSVDGVSLLGKSNVDAMETLKTAMLEHGKSSPCMSITVARDLPPGQKRSSATPSTVVPQANPTELNHIIRVPSQLNMNISPSPNSDISPPKPPRLYQSNTSSQSSSTIAGGKADPVLIEGDDSFADVSPTATSSTCTLLTPHGRRDDLRDPYDGDSSIAESDPFNRDGFARQSMSEKRHAHMDPRSLETYRRSKAALAESRAGVTMKSHTPSPSHAPTDSSELRRANSLESVVTGPVTPSGGGGSGEGKKRSKPGSAARNRGCNESFRVAVDRSYDAERADEELEEQTPSPSKPRSHSKDEGIEVLESPEDSKKQAKKTGFLHGWLRRSAKKEETSVKVTSKVQVTRSSKQEDQATKARQDALEEQQRINVHLQKFKKEAQLQKQQQNTSVSHSHTSPDVRTPPKRSQPVSLEQRALIVHVPTQGKNAKLPGPLNGTNTFVTNDPYGHYMNYDEIQKVLKRPAIPAQHHHQPVPVTHRQRPVSNYFEYGPSPPSSASLPAHNVRLGSGIYAQVSRPLGQIREISHEKLPARGGPPENIYSAVRRGAPSQVVTPTAAAMMGSQV